MSCALLDAKRTVLSICLAGEPAALTVGPDSGIICIAIVGVHGQEALVPWFSIRYINDDRPCQLINAAHVAKVEFMR